MKYRFLRFPGGKLKAVTLSYDDGVQSDIRFAEILNRYGMKGTFNLNSGGFSGRSANKLTPDVILEKLIGAGHEAAVHGEYHMAPGIASPTAFVSDVLNCRLAMERELGMIIRGLAYPDSGITKMHNGNDYQTIRTTLRTLGIAYARTLSGDNNTFMMPTDWYAWMPTARHRNPNLMTWVEEFVTLREEELKSAQRYPRLFYLWGHTYEFNRDDNWDVIENFCAAISGKDDTWYATNIEIREYAEAYDSIVTSADGKMMYNPTLKEIFMDIDGRAIRIAPGETLKL